MRTVLASVAILLASLTGGCTGPCTEFPALATLQFEFDGSNATLIQEFRDLGWEVSWDATMSSLSFFVARGYHGSDYKGTVHPSGLARAGAVEATIEGSLKGESNMTKIEEHLSPVVGPLAAKFGAPAQYGGGGKHCGAV